MFGQKTRPPIPDANVLQKQYNILGGNFQIFFHIPLDFSSAMYYYVFDSNIFDSSYCQFKNQGEHNMKRLGYFERLSLAARWLLPRGEADSMIEDYRDILYEVPGPEEALKRFGPPWKPVMALADTKKIRRWHLFLILMVFCSLVPFLMILWQGTRHNYYDFLEPAGNILLCGVVYLFGLDIILGGSNSRVMTWISLLLLTAAGILIFLLHPMELLDIFFSRIERAVFGRNFPNYIKIEDYILIGGLVSLLYFGFGKGRKRPMSKSLIISLCSALLCIACLYGFAMFCFYVDFGPYLHVFRVKVACEFGAVLFLLGALGGIVMARMHDSRWRAVYILCLMGMVLCFEAHNLCWNMSPSLWHAVNDYNAGIAPIPEWTQEVTAIFTRDLCYGLVLAFLGMF